MKPKPFLNFLFFSLLLVVSLSFVLLVQGVGLAPPQLRVENTPLGVKMNVAMLVVTNTGNTEPAYLIFKISCLEKTRESKLRVICLNCNRDVGIQRGDLIYPAKIIRMNETKRIVTVEYKDGIRCNASYNAYTEGMPLAMGDYVLIGNTTTDVNLFVMKKIDTAEALLNDGYCPFCGAGVDKLIFYDLPPDDVLSNVTLSSVNYPLEPFTNGMYKTVDKLPVNAHVDVDISVDVPDKAEYYGQHWEIRVMATSAKNLSALQGMGMVYGAETKFLVDTLKSSQVQPVQVNINVPWILIGALVIIGVIPVSIVLMRRKKQPSSDVKVKKESRGKIL